MTEPVIEQTKTETKLVKRIISVSIIVAMFFITMFSAIKPTLAQFQKSDYNLFEGVLDLAVDTDTETEYSAFAIVWTGGENLPVVYTIAGNFKGKVSILGAFRCDKEFRVLKSSVGGMRDIRCVRQDVFGRKTTTTLQYDKSGLYKERF